MGIIFHPMMRGYNFKVTDHRE